MSEERRVGCAVKCGQHLGYRHGFWLLGDDDQGVACHDEVVVLGIVVGGVERDGVELLLRQVPCVRSDGTTIIAGGCEE